MFKFPTLLVVIAALVALAAFPSASSAACYSSTPASGVLPDSIYDSEAGLAPELSAMRVSIDASCNAYFSYDVVGQSAPLSGDFYAWFVDVDNNPATGSQTGFIGADAALGLLGSSGYAALSAWNGASFVTLGATPRAGAFGVSVSLDRLAAANGVPLYTEGGASWTGPSSTAYDDWIPEIGLLGLSVVPFFSTAAPPPASAPSTGTSHATRCVVPHLRGLKLGAAKRKLRRAHCTAGSVVRRHSRRYAGRVIKSSPSQGRHLAAGSRVRLYVGTKSARRARGAVAAAARAQIARRINQQLAAAARQER